MIDLPGFRIDVPLDEEGFIDARAGAVPRDAEAIRAFFAAVPAVRPRRVPAAYDVAAQAA